MVKIYLDGADLDSIAECRADGYTTNPSLCRKAGIKNYSDFGKLISSLARGRPVSLEVLADDFETMEKQAREIASWGSNVYVKVPVTNTKGESSGVLITRLSGEGIKLNVTAIMSLDQIRTVARSLSPLTPAIISVFAGRIADTGVNPMPFITAASQVKHSNTLVLWASTREAYNVKQAEHSGADIITMTPDLIKKLALFGKNLTEYSRETVEMFFNDAKDMTL